VLVHDAQLLAEEVAVQARFGHADYAVGLACRNGLTTHAASLRIGSRRRRSQSPWLRRGYSAGETVRPRERNGNPTLMAPIRRRRLLQVAPVVHHLVWARPRAASSASGHAA
jgi:hypothetical protein